MPPSKQKTATLFPPRPQKFLATTGIFRELPPPAFEDVERRMIEKKYTKGESLFLAGDPAEFVWFVKEGHVKAAIHSAEGRDKTLCMVGPEKMFGACCCLGGGEYPCHSVAETDVTVVALPMRDFMILLGKYPEFASGIVNQLSQRLRQSKDMQAFGQESVEKRILHVLVNLAGQFGNTIPLTRREIAEMAGTTVETSIRTFSKLEEAGLVSSSRGRIIVWGIEDLQKRIEDL